MFGVSEAEFCASVGAQPLLGGGEGEGKSGASFFCTSDRRFLVKSLTKTGMSPGGNLLTIVLRCTRPLCLCANTQVYSHAAAGRDAASAADPSDLRGSRGSAPEHPPPALSRGL